MTTSSAHVCDVCIADSYHMGEVVFDAFVSDPIQIDIDPAVYALWLRGTSVMDVYNLRRKELLAQYDSRAQAIHLLSQPVVASTALHASGGHSSGSSNERYNSVHGLPPDLDRVRSEDLSVPFRSLSSSSFISSANNLAALAPSTLIAPQASPPTTLRGSPIRPLSIVAQSPVPGSTGGSLISMGSGTFGRSTGGLSSLIDNTNNSNFTGATGGGGGPSVPASPSPGNTPGGGLMVAGSNISVAELARQLDRLLACCERDIVDQYRILGMLDHYLRRASLLAQHCCFQLSKPQRMIMVEGYYEYDREFIREFMGAKLAHKLRKEVLEAAHRSSLHYNSCVRQFDNLRRIFRSRTTRMGDEGGAPIMFDVEEHGDEEKSAAEQQAQMHSIEFYQKYFLLSPELARRYNRVIFLCRYRFDTGFKKKLPGLNYSDLDYFAHTLLNTWGRGGEPDHPIPHPLLAPAVAAALATSTSHNGGNGGFQSQPATPSSVINHGGSFMRGGSESQLSTIGGGAGGAGDDGRAGDNNSVAPTPVYDRDRSSMDFTGAFAAAASSSASSNDSGSSSDDRASFTRPTSIPSLITAVGRQGSSRDLNIIASSNSTSSSGNTTMLSPPTSGSSPPVVAGQYGQTAPASLSHHLFPHGAATVSGTGATMYGMAHGSSPAPSPRVALPSLFVPSSPHPGSTALPITGTSVISSVSMINTPAANAASGANTAVPPSSISRATSSGPMLVPGTPAGTTASLNLSSTTSSASLAAGVPRSPLSSMRGSFAAAATTAQPISGTSSVAPPLLSSPPPSSSVVVTTAAYPYTSPPDVDDDDEHCWMGDTLDMKFIDDLADLKVLSGERKTIDEYSTVVGAALRSAPAHSFRPALHSKMMKNFGPLVKTLASLAANLPKNKQLRGLFVDLYDEVVKPMVKMGLGLRATEVQFLFAAMINCFPLVKRTWPNKQRTIELWVRFLTPMPTICTVLYVRAIEHKS